MAHEQVQASFEEWVLMLFPRVLDELLEGDGSLLLRVCAGQLGPSKSLCWQVACFLLLCPTRLKGILG
jgi:hypothetical protein